MYKLKHLKAKHTVYVFGGAVSDELMSVMDFPTEGSDCLASDLGFQVGGCGMNVLRIMTQLKVPCFPGIIVGKGRVAKAVKKELKRLGYTSNFKNSEHDNGHCMVLISPNAERTFITVMGAENYWQEEFFNDIKPKKKDIVYVSGYELLQPLNEALVNFLKNLPLEQKVFFDLGPMAESLAESLPELWSRPGAILSINNDEFKTLHAEQILDPNSPYKPEVLIHRNGAKPTKLYLLQDDKNYEMHEVECFETKVIDSVGAGDAFAAGYLTALAANEAHTSAARYGNACGAVALSQKGPSIKLTWPRLTS